ncbi:uncharacterized protein LOC129587186 [Paramacrobiotus metropolitanus]|uniref:uncharacterized protein LOC129587186 n=1 Tax=Paramacrobiotus metropolitanus TaxID=2943436 RepID=UPI002445980F|nr:uncharacterized protein LOC129587186 [Paramacrobiotus metropolitanus]
METIRNRYHLIYCAREADGARQYSPRLLTKEIWKVTQTVNRFVVGLLSLVLFRGLLLTVVTIFTKDFEFTSVPETRRLGFQVVWIIAFVVPCAVLAASPFAAQIYALQLYVSVSKFRRRSDAHVNKECMTVTAARWLWASRELNTVINVTCITSLMHGFYLTNFTIAHCIPPRPFTAQARMLFPVLILESVVYLVGSYCQRHIPDLQSAVLSAWYHHEVDNHGTDDLPKSRRILKLLKKSVQRYGTVTVE